MKYDDEKILEVVKQKEEVDRLLLTIEFIMCALLLFILFVLIFISTITKMTDSLSFFLIIIGSVICVIVLFFALKIEQVAGYYECSKCNHKYIPTYLSVLFAMHICRIRYMKCPKCNERSWQKKVIRK